MIHESDMERQKRHGGHTDDSFEFHPHRHAGGDKDDPDVKSVATLRWGFGVALAVALALALALCASVQAHGMYEGLRNANGDSCCNEVDCKPVPHRFTDTGVEIRYSGVWYPVDYDRIVGTSQDERYHACKMLYDAAPRCFLTPGGEV